jgi:hypothetical protein
MATVQGLVDGPLEQVREHTRRVAAEQGWALAEADSGSDLLVFKKGVSAFSWGAQLSVSLDSPAPAETRLTIATGETFAITDWGRGKRAAGRLLDGLGARRC